MHERVERHFVVSARGGGRGRGRGVRDDGRRHRRRVHLGRRRASLRRSRRSGRCPSIGLAVRMGIHTGEVERVGDDFRGRSVNRAARIMAVGHGGQILLSDVSAALARSGLGALDDSTDLGTHRLRDLTEPERLWQVVHPDLRRQFPPVRGLDTYSNNLPAQRSSLVGRDGDVQRVVALTQRHRIVTLTGVGGVGKTRLAVQAAAELLSRVRHRVVCRAGQRRRPRTTSPTRSPAPSAAWPRSTRWRRRRRLWPAARRLLVVDNCEHVVDSVAAAIDVLTAACPDLVRRRDQSRGAGCRRRARARRAIAGSGDDRRRAVPATGGGRRCRPRDARPGVDRRRLPAARRHPAGDRAGGGADGDARRRGHRRRARLTGSACERRSPAWRRPPRHDAGDDRVVVPPARCRRAADVPVAGGVPERRSSSTPSATSPTSSGSPGRRPPSTSSRSCTRACWRPSSHAAACATGCSRRCARTPCERLDEHDERLAALTALAAWMTTHHRPAVRRPVQRRGRTERDPSRTRGRQLARGGHGGDSTALGRAGGGAVRSAGRVLPPRPPRPRRRRPAAAGAVRRRRPAPGAVLTALIVSASGATEPAQLQAWAEEVQRIDDADPTGLGGLMRWMALAWRGDFVGVDRGVRRGVAGRAVCARARATCSSGSPCSTTSASPTRRATRTASSRAPSRSRIAPMSPSIGRRACSARRGGLAGTDPDRSLQLVRRAINEVPDVPALTRLTLPGSASRLLTRLDPRVAARGLLEQLDATTVAPVVRRPDPAVLRGHAARRAGRPLGRAALITVTAAPTAAAHRR